MKKELNIEIKKVSEHTAEVIVMNDRPNLLSEVIEHLRRYEKYKEYMQIDIFISNGYLEGYSGTWYPEFRGTDKEFNANGRYYIEKTNEGLKFVHPDRYCETGEQFK